MLDHIMLENILFLDIETVPQYEKYEMLPEQHRALWDHKAALLVKDGSGPGTIYERAGIYAEFGKIICISTGILTKSNGAEWGFRIKSFAGEDEKKLLRDFTLLLKKLDRSPRHLLCAHNGKEFDFPYIARRILINGLKLPRALCIAGKKPWEVPHLDTMELWKFGDYKHYSSLNLLASIFDIPCPKDDINGEDVARVFYKEKELDRIIHYCQKDVLTVARIILKYKGEKSIDENQVTIIQQEQYENEPVIAV